MYGALSDEGLRVGSLKSKNLALLCKWLWRFKNEESSLWVKDIKAIHGADGLQSQPDLRASGPWADILKSGRLVNEVIPEFASSCERVMGGGRDVRFCFDSWIVGMPLRLQFKRLFALDLQQDASVEDKIRWEDDTFSWCWRWRHEPRGREVGELAMFLNLLQSVTLSREK